MFFWCFSELHILQPFNVCNLNLVCAPIGFTQEWEKCVDKAREKEQDFVDSCLDKTKALKECLEAHPDYYAPVLVRASILPLPSSFPSPTPSTLYTSSGHCTMLVPAFCDQHTSRSPSGSA